MLIRLELCVDICWTHIKFWWRGGYDGLSEMCVLIVPVCGVLSLMSWWDDEEVIGQTDRETIWVSWDDIYLTHRSWVVQEVTQQKSGKTCLYLPFYSVEIDNTTLFLLLDRLGGIELFPWSLAVQEQISTYHWPRQNKIRTKIVKPSVHKTRRIYSK